MYRRHVLEHPAPDESITFDADANCLFTIKHMASLAPIAQQLLARLARV